MESDLATLQSHRAKREQEASMGRALTSTAPNTTVCQQSQQISTDLVPAEKPAGEDTKVADAIMADPVLKVEAPGPLEQQSEMTSNISPNMDSSTPMETQNSDPPLEAQPASIKDPTTKNDDNAAENQSGMDGEAGNATSAEKPPLEQTQASVSIKDVDFDSMFDDTVGDGSNDEINFDLDFPTHGVSSEALLGDDPFGPNVNTGNASTILAATTEDIDSLLPGLESFANAIDDFAMGNMGTTSVAAEGAVNAVPASRTAAKGANVPRDLLPPESNFDDMFFGSADFPMGEGNGGGVDDDDFGELGDFDENWFKPDGI